MGQSWYISIEPAPRSLMYRRALAVALLVASAACSSEKKPAPSAAPAGPAPDSFRVAFETTRGTFVVQANRKWAPLGVDRLHQLVSTAAFDDNAFFRVVPNFIVQFGAVSDPKVNAHWDSLRIPNEPRFARNLRGTMAFAQDNKPDSRAHQLFINLKDNAHLDSMSFVPIGLVVEGMAVVDSINPEYREKPQYHMIATLGNKYLQRMFPKLDYIKTARIVP
jgi:peptidyl-prolyl cis-trans isomerase A (cyclophilin A)